MRRIDLLIGCNASDAVFRFAAKVIQNAFGGDLDTIVQEMHAICEDLAVRSDMNRVVEKAPPRMVELAADGYPVSLINPVWNRCVRGETLTRLELTANPDTYTDGANHVVSYRGCDWYRTSGTSVWKYPDDPFLMISVALNGTGVPTVTVPQGYAVAPFQQWTAVVEGSVIGIAQ